MTNWKNKTFGSPNTGWPAFCSGCGKREDVCDEKHRTRGHLDSVCAGAVHRRHGPSDRMQKGRSMELDPKPRPI